MTTKLGAEREILANLIGSGHTVMYSFIYTRQGHATGWTDLMGECTHTLQAVCGAQGKGRSVMVVTFIRRAGD